MNSPIVSVVMSVFNGEAYLAEAVESVLQQTFRDFEFVIVDDGSTDRTAQILADYAKRDSRVRLIAQENTGRAEALNRGIGLANGPYIARMDADDISLAHRLKDQVDFMDAHADVGLLGGAYEQIDARGAVLGTVRLPLEDSDLRPAMLQYNPFCHPAVMFQREVVEAAGGYRKALLDADDYDLWFRIAERSKLANLGEVVLRYRIHPKQASVANMEHQSLCVLATRAAAMLRREGAVDPLSGAVQIDCEFLKTLGISDAEIRQDFAGTCRYWIDVLQQTDPGAAIRLNEMLSASGSSSALDRPATANLWLAAARVHYKSGRLAKSLLCTGRGLLTRPIVAGRPLKRMFSRFAARFGDANHVV